VFDTGGALEEIVLGLERRVAGRDLRLSGPVRITLPDPFLPFVLPILREFGDEHPDIAVTVAVDVGSADLAHPEADVALGVAREPPPDLVGRRLADAAVGVYGAASYVARAAGKALEELDWVGWDADSSMAFAGWMREHVPPARVRLRLTTAWAIRDAVDAGVGVGVFPCASAPPAPGWRLVHRLREAAAPLWILTHRDLRTTARVRMLRDHLSMAIVARRALIEGRRSPRPRG
jgi:DNA-binding transcriptional LysR family regulator